MTGKQKALIESAKPYEEGIVFQSIYIINSGKDYDGFWGKNKYRQIIVIGVTEEGERYKIDCNQYDVMRINNNAKYSLNFEIHKDNDCLHAWVHRPYKIVVRNEMCSSLELEVVKYDR